MRIRERAVEYVRYRAWPSRVSIRSGDIDSCGDRSSVEIL